jgi:hypothetical protein
LLPEVSASVLRERVAVAVEAEIGGEVQEQELTTEEYLGDYQTFTSWFNFIVT